MLDYVFVRVAFSQFQQQRQALQRPVAGRLVDEQPSECGVGCTGVSAHAEQERQQKWLVHGAGEVQDGSGTGNRRRRGAVNVDCRRCCVCHAAVVDWRVVCVSVCVGAGC